MAGFGSICRTPGLFVAALTVVAISPLALASPGPSAESLQKLQWLVDVPERTSTAQFWGALQELSVTGKPRLLALPIQLDLPRGTTRIHQLTVTPEKCALETAQPRIEDRYLVNLNDGKQLPLLWSQELTQDSPFWPASAWREDGLTWRGDKATLPLVLYVQRTQTGQDKILRCNRFRVDLSVVVQAPLPIASDPASKHPLLILSRQEFVQSSTQLAAYLEAKTAEGLNPLVITEEEIELLIPDPELTRAERIRTWLQQNYVAQGFKYLLIIGDPRSDAPNSIPMQTCFPAKGYDDTQDDVPTDMYYSDLTGDWDWNQNGLPCELEDYMDPMTGKKVGGVDLTPELLVGRIPHQGTSPNFSDEVLKRTLAYQSWIGMAWTNRVLLPSPLVTFPDGNYVDITQVARYLINKVLVPNGIPFWVLGEADGNLPGSAPYDQPLTPDTMASTWEEGYGVVFWCAHGNETAAYRDIWWKDDNDDGLPQQREVEEPAFIIAADFFQMVTEERPPIVFQASCLNSMPEDGGNLAHSLLRRCSIANIASTRITMGLAPGGEWEPSPFSPGAFTMGVYFVHMMMTGDRTVGEAFASAKQAVSLGVEPWTYKMRLEFNLYGDPTTRRPKCSTDAECDDASVCTGLELCVSGRCQPGTPLVCPGPDSPCKASRCDPTTGCMMEDREEGASCDDGLLCTVSDRCYLGLCSGLQRECTSANPCVKPFCDPDTGDCIVKVLEEGTTCEGPDGSGHCSGGTCFVKSAPEPKADVASPDADTGDTRPTTDLGPEPSGDKGCHSAATSPVNAALPQLLLSLFVCLVVFMARRESPRLLGR